MNGTAWFGAALALAGAVVALVSLRHAWRATAVLRAPALDRAADTESLVRVSGTVEASESPLTAPFTERECVALRARVEERRPSALDLFPRDVTLHETAGSVDFHLRTGGRRVSVERGARAIRLTERDVTTTAPDEAPPRPAADFESRVGVGASRWRRPDSVLAPLFRALSLGRRRYTEARAAVGDEVVVVGRRVGETRVDPAVVSDRSLARTAAGMAGASLAGLAVGAGACAVGLTLVA